MPKEGFTEYILIKGDPDPELRGCEDCKYKMRAICDWCTNEDAIVMHKTSLPLAFDCPFWKSTRRYSDLSWWERLHFHFNPWSKFKAVDIIKSS